MMNIVKLDLLTFSSAGLLVESITSVLVFVTVDVATVITDLGVLVDFIYGSVVGSLGGSG